MDDNLFYVLVGTGVVSLLTLVYVMVDENLKKRRHQQQVDAQQTSELSSTTSQVSTVEAQPSEAAEDTASTPQESEAELASESAPSETSEVEPTPTPAVDGSSPEEQPTPATPTAGPSEQQTPTDTTETSPSTAKE